MRKDILTREDDSPVRSATQERRVAVRFPSQLAAKVLPTGPGGGPAQQARVRDISSYGLGLLLPQRIDYGTQLIVDLESATHGKVRSVLTRVVHTTQQHDGEWLIGCALIGEMDDFGLKAFEAYRVRPPSADCRAWVRFPCNVETICHTIETAPGEQIPARIVNVSAGGIGLMIPCQFETHTLLRLQLPGPLGQLPPRVLVRVVQARPHDQGHWYLGCEFVDCLNDEEMASLSGA